MAQILIRNVDAALAADYRAAAKANGRSVEAEYREALKRARPHALADRRGMAEAVRSLLPVKVAGPEGVEIIRWYRDTSGGRDPDAFLMALVVDASVAFKWFVPEDGDAQALALLDSDQDLIAPDLIYTEVANAMWVRLRRIEGGQAACVAAQVQLKRILREVFPVNALIPRAIEIAFTIGDSVYDSVYLALCEREQSVLITADDRLIANAGRTVFAPLARRLV